LRMQNRKKDGLGLPLPSGGIVVMQYQGDEELLLADSALADKAVNEEVEVDAGSSDQVRIAQSMVSSDNTHRLLRLTLTNALDREAKVEVTIPQWNGWDIRSKAKLRSKDGDRLWALTLPANSERQIEIGYRKQ